MSHMVHIGVFSIRIKVLSVYHFRWVVGTHWLLVVHIAVFGCEEGAFCFLADNLWPVPKQAWAGMSDMSDIYERVLERVLYILYFLASSRARHCESSSHKRWASLRAKPSLTCYQRKRIYDQFLSRASRASRASRRILRLSVPPRYFLASLRALSLPLASLRGYIKWASYTSHMCGNCSPFTSYY